MIEAERTAANMSNNQKTDRIRTVCAFLCENGIPERYHDLMQAIILTLADDPDCSFENACRNYAVQNRISGESVIRACKRAVCSGWEQAESPTALLFRQRLSPEVFVRNAVDALKNKL